MAAGRVVDAYPGLGGLVCRALGGLEALGSEDAAREVLHRVVLATLVARRGLEAEAGAKAEAGRARLRGADARRGVPRTLAPPAGAKADAMALEKDILGLLDSLALAEGEGAAEAAAAEEGPLDL